MAYKLGRLLDLVHARMAADHPSESFRLVFLGDYVDRGPHSFEILKRLQELQKVGAICLRGNHEDLMIGSCDSAANLNVFLRNGGVETLASLGSSDRLLEAIDWASNLPLTYEDAHRLFVHAGIRPHVPLRQQRPADLLWIRTTFLDHPDPFPKYIVHGHSPTLFLPGASRKPHVLPHRCNLDTGAVYGGPLSAAVFTDERAEPLATITTDANGG
jgi:serine/threonine protein phosphatase 1